MVFFITVPFNFGVLCGLLAYEEPSAETLAQATSPVEVDLSNLAPGGSMLVSWQNKPIWIIRRTQAMLDNLPSINPLLRDPYS